MAASSLGAQSPEQLKEKRQRLQKELKQTNQRLQATRARRGAAIGQADLLRQQITQRTELLETLREEVARNAARMRRDSGVVLALSEDLERMGEEYGTALRAANRARLSKGWLAFLLSARGFNDAFRRAIYLRQYREYRRRQGRLIQQTREGLEERMGQLAYQRIEQDSLLFAAEDQDATLREELAIQTGIVKQLSGSEKTLLAKIAGQKRRSEQLKREIRQAINKVLAIEERNERKRKRTTGSLAPASAPTGANISQRRGRLGWPVRGSIARPFGKQPHPEVASVTITNSGIDIEAGSSADVEAIFAGEVISRREIPGLRHIIMIRHGGYYTVYSNLDHPQVKVGQKVQAGDQLGLTSSEGEALHFELWKGKTPLDPEHWLGK